MIKSFAEILRAHRLQAGLTQTELCNLVNKALRPGPDNLLTQATLSAWESKRQSPSPAKRVQLQEIARILKIELSMLDEAWRLKSKRGVDGLCPGEAAAAH